MIDDWRFQYPSTSVRKEYKGDRNYASTFDGDATKLLYELKNHMRFQALGQLKMTRFFTDGTVITASSHFGMDSLIIDVTQAVVAIVECSITFIDLPTSIPPMANAGEILITEVEGIDYIKTYYSLDTGNCLDCQPIDFTVCTTAEIAADATLCKPFYYTSSSVAHTDADANDHCVQTTSSCQAEIIDSGEDSGGTYIRWKGYTEWPPSEQSGLGYLLFKAFIKRTGDVNNTCESLSQVIVDCCEKNDSAYIAVHPEWGALDIEYTSLVMGCDESQELTAANGCPPFTWTLKSGGGALTPAGDGLTAIYQSPETNPACINNPTILLTDRCGSKELKLAVNCGDPAWVSFLNVQYEECRECGHSLTIFCDMKLVGGKWSYDCSGNFDSVTYEGSGDEFAPKPTSFSCDDPNVYSWLNCGSDNCSEFDTVCGECVEYWLNWWFGYGSGWHDIRSQAQKDGGCCPINPETGLPY